MQIVERWIMARLRHHTFFSLAELNEKIAELLPKLNDRPFQKLPGSRSSCFEALDKPALKPLPSSAYEYAEWTRCKIKSDYHVEVKKHFYSVPEHQPTSHRKQKEWTPEKAHDWAKSIGVATQEVMMRRLSNRPHPEHGYRSYLGLLKLSRRYSPKRLESACARALFIHAPTYESIASILKQGLDQLPLPNETETSQAQLPKHANVRGSCYYH